MEPFETRFLSWKATVEQLDNRLKAIANRPVDISDPGWVGKLTAVNPIDEAGVREEAAALIRDILDAYPQVDAGQRDRIRALFATHRSLAWAAGFVLPFSADPSTARSQLLLFSILDQGTDSRDALLWLGAFCGQERADPAALAPLLREVAALSSAVNRYGMGSTQSMLLHAAGEQ